MRTSKIATNGLDQFLLPYKDLQSVPARSKKTTEPNNTSLDYRGITSPRMVDRYNYEQEC